MAVAHSETVQVIGLEKSRVFFDLFISVVIKKTITWFQVELLAQWNRKKENCVVFQVSWEWGEGSHHSKMYPGRWKTSWSFMLRYNTLTLRKLKVKKEENSGFLQIGVATIVYYSQRQSKHFITFAETIQLRGVSWQTERLSKRRLGHLF